MWREDLSVQPIAWFQFWQRRRPASSMSRPSSSRVVRVFCFLFHMSVARRKWTEWGLGLRHTGHAGSNFSDPGLGFRNRQVAGLSIGDLDREDRC